MPPAIKSKQNRRLEPISHEELLGNASVPGFISFLELPDAREGSGDVAMDRRTPVNIPKPGRQARIFKAATVEDGHSHAEQAVYEALWKAATPVSAIPNTDRAIRIGYRRLGQLSRLSWVSAKANLRSLEKKLALEVTGKENSSAQEGKCYLIYSRPVILERRRKAGLEWVRKTRGVELLSLKELFSQVSETPEPIAKSAYPGPV